jgi:hypothetical protein
MPDWFGLDVLPFHEKGQAGRVPTGVYWPVWMSAPVLQFTWKGTTASARWLHEYTNLPEGSKVKKRG